MKEATIYLKDGSVLTYKSQYIWGYKDELNDTRTEFIEIGSHIIRKSAIDRITIEYCNVEVKEDESRESN